MYMAITRAKTPQLEHGPAAQTLWQRREFFAFALFVKNLKRFAKNHLLAHSVLTCRLPQLYIFQFKNWNFDQEALKFFACDELQCS
ncbi:MAG: hypothetical protein K1000chlam3_00600 [Chlamydiae bacterium]|nr:hypothetical protein [Chlamydiota bacterium]